MIAHELLTSRPLLQGTHDMDTLYRVRDMPLAPPSAANRQVPPEIDAIVMTALERDPDRRWQKASALRQAISIETRRLGEVAQNSEAIAWIDELFRHEVREDSEPSIEISRTTTPLAKGTVSDELSEVPTVLGTYAGDTAQQGAEGGSQVAAGGQYLLAVLVLIAAGGAAAVVYFALPHLA